MVKLALDREINFIDTADVYSLGESETLLGNALTHIS
jgi:aryl-alcohol dehydrogenase-like predicted oxidoreductase